MEKKTFSDFIKDKTVHSAANAIRMKMPKSIKEVDETLDQLKKLAREHNAEGTIKDLEMVRSSLIRKIEIEQDPDFLKEIFHAASAMHQVISDGANDHVFTASALAHMLTTTLSAMEEKGMIKINTKFKLK